jgi:hypothetical protein
MTNNLIVVHSGTAYGSEYVLNLWRGARRNTRVGFNFYVFTDNIDQHPQDLGWRFVKLPVWSVGGFKPWWYKLEIFNYRHQLEGNNLYIDLDTVIVNNIDDFWQYRPDQFRVCQDFNRAFNKHISWCNSSVMAWPGNSMSDLYNKFTENMQYIVHKYRGDQDFIHDQVNTTQIWWPHEWAMSWKWEIKNGGLPAPNGQYRSVEPYTIPDDTALIVCHGQPKPHSIDELQQFWNK